jgi:serine phosphatase RsbU (regulator of sigma subunit)/CheY-like chemotaxis protein
MKKETPLKVLLLEDYDLDAALVKDQLQRVHPEWKIDHVSNKQEFESFLLKSQPDIILSDYNLPSFNGMEAFLTVKGLNLEIPFIIVTGELPEEVAIECIKEGVDDYIIKNSLLRLNVAIQKAIEKRSISNNLEQSIHRYHQIFQNAGVAIGAFHAPNMIQLFKKTIQHKSLDEFEIIDFRGILQNLRLTDANKQAVKLFKAKNIDELREKFFSLFAKDAFKWVGKCLSSLGEHQEVEGTLKAKTLEGGYLYLRMTMSFDPTDNERFNVSMVDLTKARESEQRLNKVMQRLETTVEQRTKALTSLNIKLQNQAKDRERINGVLRDNYIQMTESIIAAKRIQQLMLPKIQDVADAFDDAFIYLRPKDIVSGDFYWFHKTDTKAWIACVDCTGHGVPGAFMSMIGSKILNRIIIEDCTEDTGEILNEMDNYIVKELKQHDTDTLVSTGMDISLCCVDFEKNMLQFSGAFQNLFCFQNGKLQMLKGDRYSIGGTFKIENKSFSAHTLELNEGDTFYLLSDGFADQFGGPMNKKFTRKRWIHELEAVQGLSMYEQEMKLKSALQDWKSTNEQVDDILVMGMRF